MAKDDEGKCDGCGGGPVVLTKRDTVDRVHRACAAHRRHLYRWVRDANHEAQCEDRAAERFEEMAYGRDD